MNLHSDVDSTARLIGQRLFVLVLRVLGSVLVALVVLLVLAAWGTLSWLNTTPENIQPLLVYMLESHYDARGSWDGVQHVYERSPSLMVSMYQRRWNETSLLDSTGKIVVDHGNAGGTAVGQVYALSESELSLPLSANSQKVGTLVFHANRLLEPLLLFAPVFGPFSLLALLLGVLALLIGLRLVRRLVVPLSEVIAAAQSVSEGNLAARVKVDGPSELRILIDSFNQMAESLERNDRERRELLAMVAHELRTPLSVLRGRLEGIVDGIYPADQAHIAGALEETYLLGRLVEDLRLLALAEARQLHFDIKTVDLVAVAQHAVDLFCAEAAEKQLQLELQVEVGSAKMQADPQRLEQAIGNLIVNALRYVPSGGQVVVTVRDRQVIVSDNGPGVRAQDLPLIFTRFWRGENARSRHAGGSGLGLAIAKELVEGQGGQIIAQNRPQGGLEVMIIFTLSSD